MSNVSQQQQIAHNTISRWIVSCDELNKLEVSREAVQKVYFEKYVLLYPDEPEHIINYRALVRLCNDVEKIILTKKAEGITNG